MLVLAGVDLISLLIGGRLRMDLSGLAEAKPRCNQELLSPGNGLNFYCDKDLELNLGHREDP